VLFVFVPIGSVLFIIVLYLIAFFFFIVFRFFVLLTVYVIGGVLINKYKFGVQSMPEMCPNYQFWAGVPSLIKDGIVFTCGIIKSGCSSLCQKCNKNNKYENIP